MNKKINYSKVMLYFCLTFGALLMFYPFFYMVMGSFMTDIEFKSVPPHLFPSKFLVGHYVEIFKIEPFGIMFINSLIVTIARIICAVLSGIVTAYAFAKLRFPFKNTLFAIILSIMMIPGQIFVLPQYLMMSHFHLTNTIFALIFPGLASVYGIFYMRQQIKTIPNEIIESAKIDGASEFKIIFKIVTPMVKPGIVVLSLSAGLTAWNDFMWPMIVNSDQYKMPIAVGINLLNGQYAINTPLQLAGATFAIIPVIIVFIFMQRFFANQGFGSAIK